MIRLLNLLSQPLPGSMLYIQSREGKPSSHTRGDRTEKQELQMGAWKKTLADDDMCRSEYENDMLAKNTKKIRT